MNARGGVLLWMLGSATALAAQSPVAVVGCYAFEQLTFDVYRSGQRDSTNVVRLRSDTAARGSQLQWRAETVPTMYPATPVRELPDRYTGWSMVSSDSLRLDVSSGLHGKSFRLQVVGDTLRGRWTEITDVVGPPLATGSARAVRVSCADGGDPTLTSRDSVALIDAVVADLRATYPSLTAGTHALDTTNVAIGTLEHRILALVFLGTAARERTTPRVRLSEFSFSTSSASLRVSFNACHFEPREVLSGSTAMHQYVLRNGAWMTTGRSAVTMGHGVRCPY
jgi:hypothetical protein